MTPNDLIRLALRDAGVNGVGQQPSAEDNNDAFTHLNMMLAQWSIKRWLVYHTIDVSLVSTGAASYTIGTGGDFNTPRPDKIEAAFLRFLSAGGSNADFPIGIINAREDYNRIRVKSVGSAPYCVFYDAAYPLGTLYFYPVATASLYEMHLTLKHQLIKFPNLTTAINLPDEYQEALLYNLGLRLCMSYQIEPSKALIAGARASLSTLRQANTQIPHLRMPSELLGGRGRFSVGRSSGGGGGWDGGVWDGATWS